MGGVEYGISGEVIQGQAPNSLVFGLESLSNNRKLGKCMVPPCEGEDHRQPLEQGLG